MRAVLLRTVLFSCGCVLFFAVAPAAVPEKNILDVQPFKETTSVVLGDGRKVELININHHVNVQFLLQGLNKEPLDLENPNRNAKINLTTEGLEIGEPGKAPFTCSFAELTNPKVEQDIPFISLCNSRILWRRKAPYEETNFEKGKNYAPAFVSNTFKFAKENWEEYFPDTGEDAEKNEGAAQSEAPLSAAVLSTAAAIASDNLEIPIGQTSLNAGQWYASQASGQKGIHISLIRPNQVDTSKLNLPASRVFPLLDKELNPLVYLVSFDLNRFEFGYSTGALEPQVGWARGSSRYKEPGSKGPDGFNMVTPLTKTGILPPQLFPKVIATFVGGFKREESAFQPNTGSEYASAARKGSYYGAIQNGVIHISPSRDLATVVIRNDGSFWMGSWTAKMNEPDFLKTVRFARQNGLPIIEGLDDQGRSVPGAYVNKQSQGNWSEDDPITVRGVKIYEPRQIRAGLCWQADSNRNNLIFAYFTKASPSSMATVFAAYRCNYALLLDMNSSEAGFLATYERDTEGKITAYHINKDTAKHDDPVKGLRFLERNNLRDFFYVLPKEN